MTDLGPALWFCIAGAILVMPFLMWHGAGRERLLWNGGQAPCGERWTMFDVDSQGGRMYKCEGVCRHRCDISYPGVDK